jgi:hypothetical protein
LEWNRMGVFILHILKMKREGASITSQFYSKGPTEGFWLFSSHNPIVNSIFWGERQNNNNMMGNFLKGMWLQLEDGQLPEKKEVLDLHEGEQDSQTSGRLFY